MFDIHNKEELRTAYSWLRMYENDLPRNSMSDSFTNLLKRNIRKYVSQPISDHRVIKDYGIDGAIILHPLPTEIQSKAEAETFFRRDEYMDRPCSWIDTGRPFTSWYKIFRRRDRYWVYHSVAFDV